MKTVHCSNCGKCLNITRKALRKYGTIINIVEYHECGPEVEELNLTSIDIPSFVETEGKNEFVLKLNDLATPKAEGSLANLRDRREDRGVKPSSSAPPSVLDRVKGMENSAPARDLVEEDIPESED